MLFWLYNLLEDGDLFLLVDRMLRLRGLDTVRVTMVSADSQD